MEALRFCLVWSMWLLRVVAAVLFLWRGLAGEFGCLAWAALEAVTLMAAAENESAKRLADRSWASVGIVGLYLAGGLVLPIGATTIGGQVLMAFAALGVGLVRLQLGRSYSVGGTTWVGLVDRGPYRFVRHPVMLAELLARLAIVAAFPSWESFAAWVVFLGTVTFALQLEERWLLTIADYRAYASRVRWRLVPAVW